MTSSEISSMRLVNQQISAHTLKKPKEVVSWMGAMQAQDYAMARWAVGVRLPGTEQSVVQRAIDRGDIIRTHLPRATWHLVANQDASWMLDLAAPQLRRIAGPRLKELNITPADIRKSLDVFSAALEGGKHLTREEMIAELRKRKVDPQGQRAAYLLFCAEIEKVICSGALVGKKNTYALFDERVKTRKALTRDEGLAALALRYFTSRGPATLEDFVNWSALSKADAKTSLDLIGRKLIHEKIESTEYWFPAAGSGMQPHPGVHLLPAFDEFIIGYRDRSAVLPSRNKSAVISINGIFWPAIVVNGMVTGIWKKHVSRKDVQVELRYFPGIKGKNDPEVKRMTAEATERVRLFFGEEI